MLCSATPLATNTKPLTASPTAKDGRAGGRALVDDRHPKNSKPKGTAEAARHGEATAHCRPACASLSTIGTTNFRSVDKETGQPRRRPPGRYCDTVPRFSDVQLYEEALRAYGLEYYLVGGHAFYAQQEIYDVLNLLRAVASPADEISLAGVLRSPFFSLEDETLFWLVEGNCQRAGSKQRRAGNWSRARHWEIERGAIR